MSDPRFADLRTRVLSGLVMAAGLAALWLGGHVFAALVIAIAGLMTWELYRLLAPEAPPGRAGMQGVAAAVVVAIFTYGGGGWLPVLGLLVVSALMAARAPRDPVIFGAYLALILLAAHGLVALRWDFGIAWVLWVVLIVIAADMAGYFAGRLLGGPKFWPRISPKKTWSGTVAGWLAGALIGAAFMPILGAGAAIVALSVLLAFAGQMGDIAESAIKRRAGVKDSSALIPGHGGVLDRFDAMIAVALAALLMTNLGLLQAVAGAAG